MEKIIKLFPFPQLFFSLDYQITIYKFLSDINMKG